MRRGNLGSAGLPLRRRAADPMADYDRLPSDLRLQGVEVGQRRGAGLRPGQIIGQITGHITGQVAGQLSGR